VRCQRVLVGLAIVCLAAAPLQAQRRGALEIGGTFAFQSGANLMNSDNTQLSFDCFAASYLSRDYSLDIQPSFQVMFTNDSTKVSSLLLAGLGKRLVDLTPNEWRVARNRKREIGSSASVFGSIGAGLWISGIGLPTQTSHTSTGPAIYAGLSTRTYLGNMTSLLAGFKYVYLFPSGGGLYNQARTMWQIGIGLTVFLHA